MSLTVERLPEVAARIKAAPYCLLCIHLEGPLAPLLDRPELADLRAHLRADLEQLASRDRLTVVILSGHNREELHKAVGVPGAFYAGNHGLEIGGPGVLFVEPNAASYGLEIKHLVLALRSRFENVHGIRIDHRGFTCSVEIGEVPEAQRDEIRRQIHGILASSSHPYLLKTEPTTFEIRPRVYWNECSAVKWIKEHLRQPSAFVVFVSGASAGEEFAAEHPDALHACIGAGAKAATSITLESVDDLVPFLDWLKATV